MSSSTVIHCPSACVITVDHRISVPPFDLSVEDALQIGSAILLVWAVGFTFRALIRMARTTDSVSSSEE